MKNRKTVVIVILALALLIGAVCAWTALRPKTQEGAKTITVNVDHLEGEDTSFTFRTDEEYLRGALEQEGLVGGVEGEYGLWVQTVDGETADDANQEWWGFNVNGALGEYGVDGQVVTDGDVYDFTLNVGYDW